jgi:hypothetical protein
VVEIDQKISCMISRFHQKHPSLQRQHLSCVQGSESEVMTTMLAITLMAGLPIRLGDDPRYVIVEGAREVGG